MNMPPTASKSLSSISSYVLELDRVLHEIRTELDLEPFFEVVLISGDLGYRKPHLSVFEALVHHLGLEKEEIAFVGDDPEADVAGALGAGLQPVWTTYVRDNNITPAPGVVVTGEKDPDLEVPRISDWEDLLSILDLK